MDFSILQFGLAPALAGALLHSLWQATLLGLAAALVLEVANRRSAAWRHNVGMAFLLAMVAAPMVAFARFFAKPAAAINDGVLPAMTAPAVTVPGVYVQESASLSGVLALLWLLGAGAMLLRHFGGWRLVDALDRRAHETLPPEWLARVEALRVALRISRRVTVRLAAGVASPFTARLLRPVVWLPLSMLARMPAEQVEALLAHELAHVARLDWLWNGVQCVVESLLFFHPAAWWLGRRIRLEREQACDDLAVRACEAANPQAAIALAEALAHLECDRRTHPRLVLAAQGGSLMQRITRLLSGSAGRARWRWPAALLTAAVVGTLLVSQVAVGRFKVPNVHIVSTTDGAMGPGDVREITATGFDIERHYVARVDAHGKVTELYEENGVAMPMDANARYWLAEITRLSVPPPPPPAPPPPPVPDAPPPPPAPPEPPEIVDSPAIRDILRLVAADQGIVRAVGSPMTVVADSFEGTLDLSDRDNGGGSAEFTVVVGGPKGLREVEVEAERVDQRWHLLLLDIDDR